MTFQAARFLLVSILEQIPNTRPLPSDVLQSIVSRTLTNNPSKTTSGWDACLRREITGVVSHKSREGGQLDEAYFDNLFVRLDISLACAELEAAEASLPLAVLSDLFDMHTIDACMKLFDWLESRSARLTKNMIPSKGKALVLLRQLNSLVRRVSKTGGTAKFNGRILNFLSGAFPLGERSGVNLRGDYGAQWEDVSLPPCHVPAEARVGAETANTETEPENAMKGVEPAAGAKGEDSKPPAVPKTELDERVEFYQTFWSVQNPFSNPSYFQNPDAMATFRANVSKILPALTEATRKDRLSSTSKSATPAALAGAKRKRDTEIEANTAEVPANGSALAHPESSKKDYFFAKFLTNLDLLELEIADLHFRRQILIQLLILFNYLRTYQASEKDKWAAKGRGTTRPRRLEFTLNDDDTKWVREMWDKCLEELRAATGSAGFRTFQDTVSDLLDREKAWARWKNDGCPSFEKPPLPKSEFEQASAKRRKFLEPIPPLAHPLGTEDLTDTWENGYSGLDDLEQPPRHTSFDRYFRDFRSLNRKIEMKEKQLAIAAARKAAQTIAPAPLSSAPPGNADQSRLGTPPPSSTPPAAAAAATITLSPHGLPPKPANPLGIPSRTSTTAPAVTSSAPSSQNSDLATAPASVTPTAPPKEVVVKVRSSDAQLDGFLDQRETLIWRGLRAAAQEGFLHLLSKTKDSKDTYAVGDLEKLQIKIQNTEAEAASKSTPAANSLPTPIVTGGSATAGTAAADATADGAADIGDSSRGDITGTDEGASMILEIDMKNGEEDVRSAVTEASKSCGASDVEMAEAVKTEEVKMESQQ